MKQQKIYRINQRWERQVSLMPGLLGIVALPIRGNFDEHRPHSKAPPEFYVRVRVANHDAGCRRNCGTLCDGLFKHARQWFPTVALMPVMRTEIEIIDMRFMRFQHVLNT